MGGAGASELVLEILLCCGDLMEFSAEIFFKDCLFSSVSNSWAIRESSIVIQAIGVVHIGFTKQVFISS